MSNRKKRVTYKPSKPMAAMSFGMSIVFIILGVTTVIPMSFSSGFLPAGLFGLAWTGAAVGFAVTYGRYLFGKSDSINWFGRYEVEEEQPEQETVSTSPAETHDHIPSTALDAKRRLEQLESLKTAGLIDDREYREKRQEILKEL